jgi:hypothetical protein
MASPAIARFPADTERGLIQPGLRDSSLNSASDRSRSGAARRADAVTSLSHDV